MAIKKRTLKQVHAKILRLHKLLEKTPAWRMSEQKRIANHILALEEEQYKLLGIPNIGSGVSRGFR